MKFAHQPYRYEFAGLSRIASGVAASQPALPHMSVSDVLAGSSATICDITSRACRAPKTVRAVTLATTPAPGAVKGVIVIS